MSYTNRSPTLIQFYVRPSAMVLTVALLMFRSPSVEGYEIVLGSDSYFWGENLSFTATTNRISVSDFFNQYSETTWNVDSVVDDGNGGVFVYYDWTGWDWDSYVAYLGVSFRIDSGNGNLTPEPVTVEAWGASFYQHSFSYGACCGSDSPRIEVFGPIVYEAARGAYSTFADTYTLLSNTDYYLWYSNIQYVEGTPQYGPYPREHFNSWEEYNDYIAAGGGSGSVYASAYGFFDFNMALLPTSVPEPSTLALFGLGLAGLGFARRRKHA